MSDLAKIIEQYPNWTIRFTSSTTQCEAIISNRVDPTRLDEAEEISKRIQTAFDERNKVPGIPGFRDSFITTIEVSDMTPEEDEMNTDDMHFSDNVPADLARQIVGLPDWLDAYFGEHLVGEEVDPAKLLLRQSGGPTVASIQRIGELEVSDIKETESKCLTVTCRVDMDLELDLNNEQDEQENVTAILELTITVDLHRKAITDHEIHEICDPNH